MAVVTSVMRIHQILLARADAVLRPHRLTFARYEILMLLTFSKNRELPLGKVGERLQVQPASVTSAVDRLERDRFVVRKPNPTDGRGTLACLTDQGRATADAATAALNADLFDDLVGGLGLDPLKQAALFDAMRALRRSAGDFE